MSFCCVLLLCIFSAMNEGSVGLVTYRAMEGKTATIMWRFPTSGKKYFCKDDCKDNNTLVETYGVSVEKGRHSIKYKDGNLYALITNLNRADSGRYRIGVGSLQQADSYKDFQIQVLQVQKDGHAANWLHIPVHTEPSGGTLEVTCPFLESQYVKFLCKGHCLDGHILIRTTENTAQVGRYSVNFRKEVSMKLFLLVVTISHLDKSDSGRYSCGLGQSLRSASIQEFDVSVTGGPSLNSTSASEPRMYSPEETETVLVWPLILFGFLVFLFAAIVLLLLIKWKRKANSAGQAIEFNPRENVQEDTVYQSIDSSARVVDQAYCALNPAQHIQHNDYTC
ncbi:polymeric immunoglobulin receptor-like [Corythoichthys intestinalis]|uniref:polymeric immunoglobulin receptor-like n=1 Tax=Corythoichthys intestinalis TaxID=161448 RepID=UPI0025A5004B|nr:polymeric immunoglobulin receptor-like [Corythoichthys intestinalis]